MMDKFLLEKVVKQLKSKEVIFDEGLSDAEIQHIEAINEFFFPPDLKAFLQYALPISREQRGYIDYFPKWRSDPATIVRTSQKNVLDGIIWTLENHDAFWLNRWGTRPTNISDAVAIIRRDYETAPLLVPVFGHRYMPTRPRSRGNPVFSIVGVDIVTYGMDLLAYLKKEFQLNDLAAVKSQPIKIEFWDDLLVYNNTPLF
jgi:hypothetical protein